jgi:tRNA threonylcarbamoyl adenosine modification protein YeaZ
MLLLALDTAGPNCAVALASVRHAASFILASSAERLGRGHAERLLPMIEAILAETGRSFAELDRVAVATGPGGFTGVRVGTAVARALELTLSIQAVGVGSLAALAADGLHNIIKGTAVGVLDAKRRSLRVRSRHRFKRRSG